MSLPLERWRWKTSVSLLTSPLQIHANIWTWSQFLQYWFYWECIFFFCSCTVFIVVDVVNSASQSTICLAFSFSSPVIWIWWFYRFYFFKSLIYCVFLLLSAAYFIMMLCFSFSLFGFYGFYCVLLGFMVFCCLLVYCLLLLLSL